MPVYKGSAEVTSGNLHKGSAEIQDGYKGSNSFFVNQITVAWASPVAVITDMTVSNINPGGPSGLPGSTFPNTSFTITSSIANTRLSGTAAISGLPPGLTSTQSYNNTSYNNTLTINITGVFPATSYSNVLLTITGIVDQLYTSSGLTFTGPSSLNSPAGLGPYSFNWNGIGKGYINYGGYFPLASDPLYPANFHDNIQVFVSSQGSGADFQNTPQGAGIFGPTAISSTVGSQSPYQTKNPATPNYYGVSGTTNGGAGASSNSGSFSIGPAVFDSGINTDGNTSVSFSVEQDDVNYYISENITISVTVT